MMGIGRSFLRFAAGFAGALFLVGIWSVTKGRFVAKTRHVALFSPQAEVGLPLEPLHRSVVGRVLASGVDFGGILDIVPSGDWLMALRMENRLTGLNLRNGTVRDFSALLAGQIPHVEYEMMWAGRSRNGLLLGNISRTISELSVTSEGGATISHSYDRATDVCYSIPVVHGRWISNGFYRDQTTLTVDELVGDHLKVSRAVRRPVFPRLPPFVSLEANRNSIVANPEGGLLAQAFWFAPRIYIYDSTGALEHSFSAPVRISQVFGERFVHGDVRMRYFPETTRCYISVAATDRRVFGLFSGKAIRELGTRVEASELHTITWNGDLVEIVNLDSQVSAIAASSDGQVLWAARREPNPAILEYRLDRSAH